MKCECLTKGVCCNCKSKIQANQPQVATFKRVGKKIMQEHRYCSSCYREGGTE